MDIRPFEADHLDAVIQLALRAWEPVFESLENVMDPVLYREFYPDWRVTQRDAVAAVCADPDTHVWVAVKGSTIAGFVALKTDAQQSLGEIYMIAVEPEFQKQGIASALTNHSLDWFTHAGIPVVMVETGADPGHAPARRTYESAGLQVFPVARYFKKL